MLNSEWRIDSLREIETWLNQADGKTLEMVERLVAVHVEAYRFGKQYQCGPQIASVLSQIINHSEQK